MKPTFDKFSNFLKKKNLHMTLQRKAILESFILADTHVSADELSIIVKKKHKDIGQTTVFRTLKLLCEAGIAQQVTFHDKIIRFERKIDDSHHDHLICSKCGHLIEAMDPKIEELQNKLCEQFGFTPLFHRMEIFGLCKTCKQ